MLNFIFDNPEDEKLLNKVVSNLSTQLEKGIRDLDKRLKDLMAGSDVNEIKHNLNYITISRFNLMITLEYVDSELAFKTFSYGDNSCSLAISRHIMEMLAICDNIVDKIVATTFSGAFKYQYSIQFMNNPEEFFNSRFFSIKEENSYKEKGSLS